jgi:RHS repeat-associated protein
VNYDYWTVPSSCPASLGANSSGLGFHPTGAARCDQLGSGVAEGGLLNARLQPSQNRVVSGATVHIDRTYNYGTANNGNIAAINDMLNANKSQAFLYDQLNRITRAEEGPTAYSAGFGLNFTVDAWGNLTSQSVFKGNPQSFAAAALSNNRLSGYTYDAAGNMTQNGSATYVYDGESRIKTAGGFTYIYDANGMRVRKRQDASPNNWTEYIYFGSEVIAEKDQAGAWTDYIFAGGKRIVKATGNTSAGTEYYHADHLGSARKMTDTGGGIVWSATYLPYGQLYSETGTATNHYKFTGKVRDSETGLDYFGARYYGSNMGRFLTPDWSAAPTPVPYADLNDPQTLNLYGYVRNNPTNKIDADGHSLWRTLFEVGVQIKKTLTIVGKTNEISKPGTVKAVKNLLRNSDTRDGAKRVVVAETEAARDALGKALSSDKKMRGPERSGKYAEHVNPNDGEFSDVHIETKDAAKEAGLFGAVGTVLAPYSDAAAKSGDATASEIGSAALWDAAKAIDPIFVTDAIEWAMGMSPRGSDEKNDPK